MSPRLGRAATQTPQGRERRLGRRSRRSYDGRLQGIANGVAVGWAWDPHNEKRRVPVSIEVDGQVITEGIADIRRDELVAEGLGDGAHGFEIALPEMLQSYSYVRIVALAGRELELLPRSSSFWQNAKDGSLWSSVKFILGREGDPEADAEVPVEVPPPPDSPVRQALVGRDGWLFDAAEHPDDERPDDGSLQRLADLLSDTAAACAALGITYIAACVPDKLQAFADEAGLDGGSDRPWLTGLRARLRDRDGVDLLDLLPVLEDARRHGPCYQRSDPDWNDRAGFFVSRALIKEASKRSAELRPLLLSSLHLRTLEDYRGELADAPKVKLEQGRLTPTELSCAGESAVRIDPAKLHVERSPVERHLVGADVHVRLWIAPESEPAPRLSIVGDGACLALLPWLAESVARATFFWTLMPPMEPVELELPDAVLHLIRYRDLARLAVDRTSS
jgi:hypothetical protein